MTERLGRFTPNASGLDRDALLFAAGQRASRGSRLWTVVAGLLTATQVATLIALWPRAMPTDNPVPPAPPVAPTVVPTEPTPSSPPPDMWRAGSSLDVLLDPPRLSQVEFVSAGPPLTALSGHRFD